MKKHIAIMLVIMLLLPQIVTFTSLSADGDIVITTGAEFVEKFKTFSGKTFIIDGTETLPDGSKGIIIPTTYKTQSSFYGTVRGIDGKNNIQVPTMLLTANAAAGESLFENLIFKGDKKDGTGSISVTPSGNGVGVLIGQAALGPKLTVKNVINYVNVNLSVNNKQAAGIVGRSTKHLVIENCINYGNISATGTGTAYAGGIIGYTEGQATITLCYNYGTVNSKASYAGGIIGYGKATNVINCANYGEVKNEVTSGTAGVGGIAGYGANVSGSFNAGKVTSALMAGGILGHSADAAVTVDNCFNVGEVKSTDTSGTYFAGGIAGSIASTLYTVTNSYNAGTVTGTGAKQIGDTKTNDQDILCEGNLYVSDTDLGEVIGTNITSEALSSSLPSNFSSSVWEIVSSELMGEKGYTYPQIKNNWYDHKFKLDYKNFADYKSETSGEVTGVDTVKFDRNTSVYKDVNTATILEGMTYPGLTGALLILNESTNTSGTTEFTVNKPTEIILAVNKELGANTDALKNKGFKPLKYLDTVIARQAGLVTKDGTAYYLYKKIVLDTSEIISIDASDMGLTKGFAVFVNWVDSGYSMTIENKGNAKVEIDGVEKTDTEPIALAKGTYYDVEVTPDANYYIKSITLNKEKIAENMLIPFKGSYNGNKNLSFVVETSQYSLTPLYTVKQSLGAGNVVTQALVVKGQVEEFLDGATVTCTIEKESSVVYTKSGTIDGGNFTIEFPLLDTDTGVHDISFTVEKDGFTSDIVIDDDKKTYDIPTVEDVRELLGKLNKVDNKSITADEFTSLVLEERASLPFEAGVFKYLDSSIQSLISEAFVAYEDFTIDNLYQRFDEETILKTVNNSEISEDFKRLIDVYGLATGIENSSLYENYTALVNKEPVYAILKTGTYSNYQDIVDSFEYAVVYGELSNVTSYDSILGILDTHKTLLGIETEVTTIGNMVDAKIKIVNDETGKSLGTLITKDLLKAKLQYLIANADALLLEKMGQTATPVLPPVIIGGNTGGGGGGGSVSVSQGYVEKETVEPIPTVESVNDFNDIGVVPWAQDSIRELLYRGIVRGKESGKFCPNDTVTRAEFVKMAVIAFNLMDKEPSANFKDVPTDHWSYPYIGSAAKTGLVSGYSKDEFGIDGHMTRQDTIAILIRVTYRLGLQEQMEQRKEKLVTFTDEDKIAEYAVGGVNMLSGCGIISGYEDGSFGPERELTRAEAATILARYLEFFEI